MPGAGGTQNLPRAVGTRRAKEIILTGKPFTAQEALEWGIVNKRLRARGADGRRRSPTARRSAGNAPISVRQAKQSMHRRRAHVMWDGARFEIEAYNRMVPTEDRHEGVTRLQREAQAEFQGTLRRELR